MNKKQMLSLVVVVALCGGSMYGMFGGINRSGKVYW